MKRFILAFVLVFFIYAADAASIYGLSSAGTWQIDPLTGKASLLSNFQVTLYGGGITYAAVPIPAAFWLFGSALGLLGWMRRGNSGRY